jgi:hypothetical protein
MSVKLGLSHYGMNIDGETENRVLRKIFNPARGEITSGWKMSLNDFVPFTIYYLLNEIRGLRPVG